jgi:Uma2 family endonuclease
MNAPVHLPTPYHRFTQDEVARMSGAGILPPIEAVEVRDGRPVAGSSERPFRFTIEDVWRMIDVAALDPDARVELIDGDLLDMAPQNAPHMYVKQMLMKLLTRRLGDDVDIHVEGTLSLARDVNPSPDIWLHDASHRVTNVRGEDVLLLIEVADSSLLRDLSLKADLYARHGVADYWVVDAYGRRIFVHRHPSPEGYGEILEIDREGEVAPLAFPDLVIRAADLPIVD